MLGLSTFSSDWSLKYYVLFCEVLLEFGAFWDFALDQGLTIIAELTLTAFFVCHLPDDNHHHPDGDKPVGPDRGADGRSVEADHEQQMQYL